MPELPPHDPNRPRDAGGGSAPSNLPVDFHLSGPVPDFERRVVIRDKAGAYHTGLVRMFVGSVVRGVSHPEIVRMYVELSVPVIDPGAFNPSRNFVKVLHQGLVDRECRVSSPKSTESAAIVVPNRAMDLTPLECLQFVTGALDGFDETQNRAMHGTNVRIDGKEFRISSLSGIEDFQIGEPLTGDFKLPEQNFPPGISSHRTLPWHGLRKPTLAECGRWAAVCGIMLSSKVPILETLSNLYKATTNPFLRQLADHYYMCTRSGDTFRQANDTVLKATEMDVPVAKLFHVLQTGEQKRDLCVRLGAFATGECGITPTLVHELVGLQGSRLEALKRLAVLVSAKVPVLQAIRQVAESFQAGEPAMADEYSKIAGVMADGRALSTAISLVPGYSQILCNLVRGGEHEKNLGITLTKIAEGRIAG